MRPGYQIEAWRANRKLKRRTTCPGRQIMLKDFLAAQVENKLNWSPLEKGESVGTQLQLITAL